MDKMRALQYFMKVAETGSYSRAAASFGVPASSISRLIQSLEAELGASLLHRTTRVVKITELGALYLEQIRPAISALTLADETIREQPHAPSGRVTMTAQPGYGGACLVPALSKLRKQYPDLIIDIELTDQVSNIASNDVDLAVRSTSEPPERSVARKLSDNQFVLVASPSYLDRIGIPSKLIDLERHRTLLYRSPKGVLHWHAKTSGGWQDVQTLPAFISNMGQALVDEALNGVGLALVPEWGVESHLAQGRLVQVSLQDAALSVSRNPNLGIYLIYHRPKYRLKKIQVTVDFLISELAEKK
jgi:DNA-binding transcriptional LysR family regulator